MAIIVLWIAPGIEVDVTRFNRHLLRSKLNWSVSLKRVRYPAEFKAEALRQMTEQWHGVVEVSNRLGGGSDKRLLLWDRLAQQSQGVGAVRYHSDRGSQYVSILYKRAVGWSRDLAVGSQQGRQLWQDNALAETITAYTSPKWLISGHPANQVITGHCYYSFITAYLRPPPDKLLKLKLKKITIGNLPVKPQQRNEPTLRANLKAAAIQFIVYHYWINRCIAVPITLYSHFS